MCPGQMQLLIVPGPTKDFLQRQNGSTPAGVALKTGVIIANDKTIKYAKILVHIQCSK